MRGLVRIKQFLDTNKSIVVAIVKVGKKYGPEGPY